MTRYLTALALLLGLWITIPAWADDPPAEGTTTEEAAPAVEDGDKAKATPEEGADKTEGDEAKEGDSEAELPDEVPVPEDIEEAVAQGGGIIDALMAKQWWLAGILVLGIVLFVVNKYVLSGKKKTEEKSE